MAKFKGAVKMCVNCGAEFRVPPSRAATAKSCSNACADIERAKSRHKRGFMACKGCGISFEVRDCHRARTVYCSKKCMEASPEIRALKAARRGENNPAWKGGSYARKDRYVTVRAFDHPLASDGNIMEHRLVMENWLIENEPDSPFLIEIEGRKHLSPDYVVHHRDFSRSNNATENLQCMTPTEHRNYHNDINRKALAYYLEHVLLA